MRIAVVPAGRAPDERDALRDERHRQVGSAFAVAFHALLPPVCRAEERAVRPSGQELISPLHQPAIEVPVARGHQGGGVKVREASADVVATEFGAQTVLHDGPDDLRDQHAFDHRLLHRVRRVMQDRDDRLAVRVEEAGKEIGAEPLRQHEGDGPLAVQHELARRRFVGDGDAESRVGRERFHHAARDGGTVLVHDQDGHAAAAGGTAGPVEHRTHERREADGHDEQHDERAAVAEVDLQVVADDGEDLRHTSRSVRPVRPRKMSSKLGCREPTEVTATSMRRR